MCIQAGPADGAAGGTAWFDSNEMQRLFRDRT
jgi:hypothetical protein